MEFHDAKDIKKAKDFYESCLNGVFSVEMYDKMSDSLCTMRLCQTEYEAEELIISGKELPELIEGNTYRLFKTKYNSNAEIIEHILVKEYTKNDIEKRLKIKSNSLVEKLNSVKKQEEYAKLLKANTENKEFNLIYDKVKKVLPKAKELHDLRKEFNYPTTSMISFWKRYPEFDPDVKNRGKKADAEDIIWVKNGIGLKPHAEYEHYVCVNYDDGTISVRNNFEKSNEPASNYKQKFINNQLNEIVEKFDNFYQCEYSKLEYELEIRQQGANKIIAQYKDNEQKLEDIDEEIEM